MVYISIGFSIFTIGAILIDWLVFHPFLQYFTLFYGVFLGYYAVRDTWDDTYVLDDAFVSFAALLRFILETHCFASTVSLP